MKDRPVLRQILQWALVVGAAFLSARFGIQVPPPVILPQEQPAPKEIPESKRKPDAVNAIGRIQFGSSGCTATIIGDQRGDGRYWALTAAHCVQSVGQRGTYTSKTGNRLTVTVAAVDKKADAAWLLTDSTNAQLAFAELATELPPVGSRVWHAGYGVDRPGNREDGSYLDGPDSNGQLRFRLNVSSGDSGGAIVLDEAGRILSCVCCTTARGQLADVWGAGPTAIADLRRSVVTEDGWTPIEVPIRKGR